MILVDAIYTNQSGSKRLLEYFIRTLRDRAELDKYFFLFDLRIQSDAVALVSKDHCLMLGTGEGARKKYYKRLPPGIASIFCFGSVPPPVKINDRRVVILAHNPFFFENPGYSLFHKALYQVKRHYIRSRCLPGYDWVVQTQRMKDLVIRHLPVDAARVKVLPFIELSFFENGAAPLPHSFPLKFIYPADGVPQKNHKYLFNVWERLFTEHKLAPELHLTLPARYSHHIERIKQLKQLGLSVFNHGFISTIALKSLYAKSHFLVFPSLSESFGLPLAEAGSTGLAIIGADLPYLHQVVQPSGVFDPRNENSLVELLIQIHDGKKLKPTKVNLKDQLSEVIDCIQPVKFKTDPTT